MIINNPGNSGILLDGWKLTDGSNTLIFENSTVIHPKDRLIIAIGPETQKDPTGPLQIKSAKSPAAFRLIPAKKILKPLEQFHWEHTELLHVPKYPAHSIPALTHRRQAASRGTLRGIRIPRKRDACVRDSFPAIPDAPFHPILIEHFCIQNGLPCMEQNKSKPSACRLLGPLGRPTPVWISAFCCCAWE